MSEETAQSEDGQEQSMEDILANIRGILSDEEDEEGASKETDGPNAEADLEPETQPAGEAAELETEPVLEPEPELKPADAATPEPAAAAPEPPVTSAPELAPAAPVEEAKPELAPMPTPESAPMPGPMEEILELTPDMVASGVISATTARASTDVLSELAAAVLDRRDMAVGASSSEMTLEGIVRGMLKPILSEWLDRNLPYLIERLVKKEIDHMINRAERLDS